MTIPLPFIYRYCRRLLVLTEDLVRRFSHYHKYTVGTDLRQSAMTIMRTVNQAVHDKPRQAQHVQVLVRPADDFKLALQLSVDVFAHTPQGKLTLWATRHVQKTSTASAGTVNNGALSMWHIATQHQDLGHFQHMLVSNWDHFPHACGLRLRHALVRRFDWLRALLTSAPLVTLHHAGCREDVPWPSK